ncbi:MAG: YvcK family protein [Myxococcaceae bacterium]|nr:YvcK family protein [Myxococcaceae bacterium]MBH2006791.1 YvcK family protein [Myxococcaceae bacterium]
MLNIVILNGGRGASALIPKLLEHRNFRVTSVVNAYDDGKSTGEIRKFFSMLGPSDIRKVQELMLSQDEPDYESCLRLFQYRFPNNASRVDALAHLERFAAGQDLCLVGLEFNNSIVYKALKRFVAEFLKGLQVAEQFLSQELEFADCSMMNCLYAGAFLVFNRDLERTTLFMDRLFRLRGSVLATNSENKKLVGLRANGEFLCCEAEIVELRSNVKLEQVYLLEPYLDYAPLKGFSRSDLKYYLETHNSHVEISGSVKLALAQADIIIYSPGTQHSSLYPTYMSFGLADVIAENRSAYKVLIPNIGADYETPNYAVSDYILGSYQYLSLGTQRICQMSDFFSVILVSHSSQKEDSSYVPYDEEECQRFGVPLMVDDFESSSASGKHNGEKTVKAILASYESAIMLSEVERCCLKR